MQMSQVFLCACVCGDQVLMLPGIQQLTYLPRIRDSPVSTHSRELRASKLEFSNSFIAVKKKGIIKFIHIAFGSAVKCEGV